MIIVDHTILFSKQTQFINRESFGDLGTRRTAVPTKAEHKNFQKTMNQSIDAGTLAQMALDQIEENDIVNLLNSLFDQMACEDPENRDYDRLFAASRLSKANKVLLDKFKKAVYELMKGPKGNESTTKVIGTRMFKLYYNSTYHWENCRLPELTDGQRAKMTDHEVEAYEEKRLKLLERNALYQEILSLEEKISPKKLVLKGMNEALGTLMPTSKCIHRTPVLQVV